jgi:hypothetical protein
MLVLSDTERSHNVYRNAVVVSSRYLSQDERIEIADL